MSHNYVNCWDDNRDSIVKMKMEYKRVRRELWRTGKSKDYVNRKRGMGCPNTQCSLCSARPTNKSLKKTKNYRNKDKITIDFD